MTENNKDVAITTVETKKGFINAVRENYNNHKVAWKIGFTTVAFAAGAYIFVKSKNNSALPSVIPVTIQTPAVAEETASTVAETVGDLVGQITTE